jgi:hypothetical protein
LFVFNSPFKFTELIWIGKEIKQCVCIFLVALKLVYNEQGFMQVGEIEFRLPGPLLIENILMKLGLMISDVCPARTKA